MNDRKNSLLIADDDKTYLMMLSEILRQDYKIYTAKNGASAIKMAQEFVPDLILLDIVMPDITGFEVFEKLKNIKKTKEIPVIFITSLTDSDNEIAALELAAVDYIKKPFNQKVFKQRIRNQMQLINWKRDLLSSTEAAMNANRAKSDFLASISHEIRTPLNVIIGLTELIMEDDTPAEIVNNYLQKINIAGDKLMNLINNVLDISKIEAGKFDLVHVRYDTARLLNDVVNINMLRIESKPVELLLEIDEDMYVELYGDDLRIKQIINNLLSNALKFTKEGSVTLSAGCERFGENDVQLSISVSDTGIGIRPEDLERVFDDYGQVDTKKNRLVEGTGLGLAITKKLTELMGGIISVESEFGKGTTFRLNIRQKYVNDNRIGKIKADELRAFRLENEKKSRSVRRPDLSHVSVLLVDDLVSNLDVAKGMLGKYKMRVDCVTSGKEAIELVSRGQPQYDLIFMDYMMPGMDGVVTVSRIRALDTDYAKSVPIIALTADATAGNEQMFLDNGFQAYIPKPVSVRKIDSVVKEWFIKEPDISGLDTENPDTENTDKKISAPDTLICIPGINEESGLSLYDYDIEMYVDVIKSFVEYIPEELKKIRVVSEDDLSSYAINVHTIKGSAAGIGALNVEEKAKKLEAAGKSGDFSLILTENEGFIKETETLISDINTWLEALQ